ncbi:type II secretion system protein [Campylobacter upsaliensis]|uniref:type II secretion system protein n=1 Tax=Campylobacter upsaliensis TaxID=28080 RepID=UPI0012C04841|nr:type II secretion system protein [Campylobacter upsaliensis]EAK3671175.1 type II secretion system protein [Campylobacter upsaliensis]ECZ4669553.1 type II secretion system protein [Campylobacter upsaliensis]EGL3838804.1 type II secretion system protein [Campylobacter upsaliensis]
MSLKKAFSLLELVFVILIIAILTGIALPFLQQNKEEAKLLKLKMDCEMLNSALSLMRNEADLKNLAYINELDQAAILKENETLFYCQNCSFSLLSTPIYSSKMGWIKNGVNQYSFFLNPQKSVEFRYENGLLKCLKNCKELL